MEEKQESTSECEECNSNPWKYKCPGCCVRTCSLPCVKAHKERTGCTGKRPFTDVVPLSQFDDNLLLSDYNMLEDVKRFSESSRRLRHKLCGYSNFRLPFPLKNLHRAAASRRTKILFLSSGMSKREKNQTYYNRRKRFISWTIEWRFNSTDVVLIDHGVHENTSLCSVIETHLKPGPWNHPLRQFCQEPLDNLKFFMQKYPKGTKSPFYQLDVKAPLRDQLGNKVVMEYPVIYVFLPSHSFNFEVEYSIPVKMEQKGLDYGDSPSPKGVIFREEEIEDAVSSDPHISDLLNCARLDPASKTSNKSLDMLAAAPDAMSFLNGHLSEGDQDLRGDACLNLDSVCQSMKERDLGREEDWSFLGEVLLPLEEGEIFEGDIEDCRSSDPHVLDLSTCARSGLASKTCNKSLDMLSPVQRETSLSNGHFSKVDQDVSGYTYLDLDSLGLSMKQKDLNGEKDWLLLCEGFHMDEELEEGEIA